MPFDEMWRQLHQQNHYQAVVLENINSEEFLSQLQRVSGLSGEHPDVFVLLPEAPSQHVRIEQVRDLIERLSLYPLGKHYVVLIPNAQMLGKAVSNALLKSLEEPMRAFFFLLVHHRQELMPTLQSRCLFFHLAQTTEEAWADEFVKDCLAVDFKPLAMTQKWSSRFKNRSMASQAFWKLCQHYAILAKKPDGLSLVHLRNIIAFSDGLYELLEIPEAQLSLEHFLERCCFFWSELLQKSLEIA